jgi:outer membrane protein
VEKRSIKHFLAWYKDEETMKKIFLLSLVMTLLTATCPEARDLTLSESIKLAIEHSYSLKSAREQRIALEHSYKAATAQRWPTLSLNATTLYKSEVTSFAIGTSSIPREFGTKENYQADFSLSVPLFTGGKITGNIKRAIASRDLASASEQLTLETLVYQTRIEHFNLIKADRLVKAAESSKSRASISYQDILTRIEAGTADSVDMNDARIVIANADLALLRANTDRKEAELRLATLLGLPLNETLEVRDTMPTPNLKIVNKSKINESKPEILAANAKLLESQSLISLARSDMLPVLSASAGYSYGKPNIDPFNKTWNDYFSIGAKLSWSFNLGNSTGHNVRQSQYFYDSFRHQKDEINDQLNRNAEISWEELNLAFTRYETSAQNFKLASRNYKLATERHNHGILTSNRLLEIEASLSTSEAELAASLIDYYIALSTYYMNIGSKDLFDGTK